MSLTRNRIKRVERNIFDLANPPEEREARERKGKWMRALDVMINTMREDHKIIFLTNILHYLKVKNAGATEANGRKAFFQMPLWVREGYWSLDHYKWGRRVPLAMPESYIHFLNHCEKDGLTMTNGFTCVDCYAKHPASLIEGRKSVSVESCQICGGRLDEYVTSRQSSDDQTEH